MGRPRTKLRLLAPNKLPDDATNLERILAELPDGRAIALSYVRQISLLDETATEYVALIRDYDAGISKDLGTLCNLHKIPHAKFLARIVEEAFPIADEALNLSKVLSTKIVAARLPKVVERGMIEGAKADGVTDRHFTLQKEGFHVAPKGMSINLNQINAQAAGLPSFEDHTRSIADVLADDAHLLEEGETDFIEAELESEDTKEIIAV